MFGHFGNNAIQLVKVDKFKNSDMREYKIVYETHDTREEVITKNYQDLVNKIKLISINNWVLLSVKRKL